MFKPSQFRKIIRGMVVAGWISTCLLGCAQWSHSEPPSADTIERPEAKTDMAGKLGWVIGQNALGVALRDQCQRVEGAGRDELALASEQMRCLEAGVVSRQQRDAMWKVVEGPLKDPRAHYADELVSAVQSGIGNGDPRWSLEGFSAKMRTLEHWAMLSEDAMDGQLNKLSAEEAKRKATSLMHEEGAGAFAMVQAIQKMSHDNPKEFQRLLGLSSEDEISMTVDANKHDLQQALASAWMMMEPDRRAEQLRQARALELQSEQVSSALMQSNSPEERAKLSDEMRKLRSQLDALGTWSWAWAQDRMNERLRAE